MDLVEECSKSRSEEGKEEEKNGILQKSSSVNETKVEVNGKWDREDNSEIKIGFPTETKDCDGVGEGRGIGIPSDAINSNTESAKVNGDGIGVEDRTKSPSSLIGSSGMVTPMRTPPAKGHGLRKWRRKMRNLSKDGSGGTDSAQILRCVVSILEPRKPHDKSQQKSDGDVDGKGESSVASVVSRNIGRDPHGVASQDLDSVLGQLVEGVGFSVGMDSENSEDCSSNLSTAASAPRNKHEAVGFGRERNPDKNLSGKGSGHVVQQRGQRGIGGEVDASKNFRDDKLRFVKENSISSVESDLRSTNAVIMHWGSVFSNGKQRGRSSNCKGEHRDEAKGCNVAGPGCCNKNGGVGESLFRGNMDGGLYVEKNTEEGDSFRPHSDLDPLVESIIRLQVAQEALEKEIQGFQEIGKEPVSVLDDSYTKFGEDKVSISPTVEANSIGLNQKVEHLNQKLEEAFETIKANELIEAILNRTQSPKKEPEKKIEELEFELENLFEKKIVAEMENLTLTRTTEDHTARYVKSVAGKQEQTMLMLGNAERKAMELARQAEELKGYCRELAGFKEMLELENKGCRSSSHCWFIQLVMVTIAFVVFLLHIIPLSNEEVVVVPT